MTVFQKAYPIVKNESGGYSIVVSLSNQDTRDLSPATYVWTLILVTEPGTDQSGNPDGKTLSLAAVAMDKVTGLSAALAGKVDAEAGKGLSSNDYTTAEKEKLAGIAAGAQQNVIEAIQLNGVALPVSEKAVNLPLATAEAVGLVKSSIAENGVSVGAGGEMTVNSLNVSKLTQTAGDLLILDGGDASGLAAAV